MTAQPVMLTKDDINALNAFHQLCFRTDFFPLDVWEDLLGDSRTLVYALRVGAQLLAILAIYNWQGEDDYVKIMSLATHPAHRHKGYAQSLMAAMTGDMSKLGMRIFKAETRVSNLPMQSLFAKLGFERTERVSGLLSNPPEDGFKYQLIL